MSAYSDAMLDHTASKNCNAHKPDRRTTAQCLSAPILFSSETPDVNSMVKRVGHGPIGRRRGDVLRRRESVHKINGRFVCGYFNGADDFIRVY